MVELTISRRAEHDLREIWRHIATDDAGAADRLLLPIAAKLEHLRMFPELGTQRDDIRPGFRMLVEGSYLLLYEFDIADNAIELIAAIDGRRELTGLF